MYASGLIYLKGENPIFEKWTPEKGGGGPHLTESDANIYDSIWLDSNLAFLSTTLSVDYIQEQMRRAAHQLRTEPESDLATKVAVDAKSRADIIEMRIEDLISGLSKTSLESVWDE